MKRSYLALFPKEQRVDRGIKKVTKLLEMSRNHRMAAEAANDEAGRILDEIREEMGLPPKE